MAQLIEQASKDPLRRGKVPVRMEELMGGADGRAQLINIGYPIQGHPIQVSAFQILLSLIMHFLKGGST